MNVALVAGMLFAGLVAQTPRSVVPYVPTSRTMVDAMLTLAEVTSRDVVYDLGCGDGRIVIAAAKQFGARGVCIDIDPELIAGARANAKAQGVERLITFRVEDFYTTELKNATVVTLYLLPSVNRSLMPRLRSELKAGARVVSNSFDMGDTWPADRRVAIEDTAIYLWKIQ